MLSVYVDLRFKACSKKALTAVLRLASLASDTKTSVLEAAYRKACASTPSERFLFADEELEDDEFSDSENAPDIENEAEQFLQQLQTETVFNDPNVETEVPDEEKIVDMELAKVPDQQQMRRLLEKPEALVSHEEASAPPQQSTGSGEFMPWSLGDALDLQGDTFNGLFRFAVRLRSARGGCDTNWVRHGRNLRRASTSLNWHQFLELPLFEADVGLYLLFLLFLWNAWRTLRQFSDRDAFCSCWMQLEFL